MAEQPDASVPTPVVTVPRCCLSCPPCGCCLCPPCGGEMDCNDRCAYAALNAALRQVGGRLAARVADIASDSGDYQDCAAWAELTDACEVCGGRYQQHCAKKHKAAREAALNAPSAPPP